MSTSWGCPWAATVPAACVPTALYCWGDNSFGETGTGLPNSTVLEPTLVEFPE